MKKSTNKLPQNVFDREIARDLLSSKDNYRQLIELIPSPIFIVGEDGLCLQINAAAGRFLGYGHRNELIGKNFPELTVSDQSGNLSLSGDEKQDSKIEHGEWEFIRQDGASVWGEIFSCALPEGNRGIFINDITEHKQLEENLFNERKFNETAINSLPGIFYLFDENGKFLRWNENFEQVSGYSHEEILKMHPLDFFEEKDKHLIQDRIKEVLTKGTSSVEANFISRNASKTPYFFTGSRIAFANAQCVIGMGIDITDLKQAEMQLVQLASLVESSGDAIISKNFDDTITSWNQGAQNIFGYSRDEIIGRNISLIVPPNGSNESKERTKRIKRGEKINHYETVLVKKDGTHIPVSLAISPIKNMEGEIIGISKIARDISLQKQVEQAYFDSEEQLRQSQKIEAVGRLAGGIAHDFNNFLAVIMLHVDMLNLQLPADSSLRFRIDEIKSVTKNAAGMVRQLLAFGRKQTLQPHPIVLNQIVKEFTKVLSPLVGEHIEINLNLDHDLGVCYVDQNQIIQVLINLALNARDAMPGGGILRIETTNITFNRGDIRKHKAQPAGSYIQLTVTDTGIGMEDRVRESVFEPFFTTKEPGKGTGLGLATVYGIIKQSNGFIWVESKINKGSSFTIHFPRIDQPVAAVPPEAATDIPSGQETILLVEDEEQVRRVAVELLNVLGYQVFEAGNGVQAIELAQNCKSPIDLLLTDVVMPKMNGKQLAEQIKILHPEIAILFMSGYNDDIIANHGVLEENVNFIGKPFSPSTLATKIREVLNSRPESNKFN